MIRFAVRTEPVGAGVGGSMRRFLLGLGVIAALLGIAYYALSAPDIPRATLEAKYATPPS